jgi:hypothetical protein
VKIAIHQPQYFPWPRYMHKALSADIFVYLDTVQFSKGGVQNRNQLKTAQGPAWITLPVKHQFGQSIRETELVDARAPARHWKTVQASYGRTPGFQRWADELRELLHQEYRTLDQAGIATTNWMLKKLGFQGEARRASEISGAQGQASELIASICSALKADTYLTGTGALAYMNPKDFADIGCRIAVQEWKPFSYEQGKTEFLPDLSTLDLLLYCPDSASALIEQAGRWEPLNSE